MGVFTITLIFYTLLKMNKTHDFTHFFTLFKTPF